jgi:hypothetical protein
VSPRNGERPLTISNSTGAEAEDVGPAIETVARRMIDIKTSMS